MLCLAFCLSRFVVIVVALAFRSGRPVGWQHREASLPLCRVCLFVEAFFLPFPPPPPSPSPPSDLVALRLPSLCPRSPIDVLIRAAAFIVIVGATIVRCLAPCAVFLRKVVPVPPSALLKINVRWRVLLPRKSLHVQYVCRFVQGTK